MVRVPWEHRERSPTSAWEKGFLEGRYLWRGGGKRQLLQEIIYAKGGGKNVQVSSGRYKELNKVSWRSLGGGVMERRDEAVAKNHYKGP